MVKEIGNKRRSFIANFSDFMDWFDLFLNFPRSISKVRKEILDFVAVDYIHINQKNLEDNLDTRCILSFYTQDNWYQIHLIKPSQSGLAGKIFGTVSLRVPEYEGQERISNNLRDGPYSEETWRKIIVQIMDLEDEYPRIIDISKVDLKKN